MAAVVLAIGWLVGTTGIFSSAIVATSSLGSGLGAADGTSRARGPPTCKDLYWLHAPKTSSTLCMTIQHACCGAQFETLADEALEDVKNGPYKRLKDSPLVNTGWGCTRLVLNGTCSSPMGHGHDPLPTYVDGARVAVFFREPRSRVLSAFLDGKHTEGISAEEFNLAQWRNNSLSVGDQMKAFAAHPSLKGCQTKMLLGIPCSSSTRLTSASTNEALRRLNGLFYVGLFERYGESVKRFHQAMRRNTSLHALELVPGRSWLDDLPYDSATWTEGQKEVNTTRIEARAAAQSALADYSDPWDDALYAAVVRLFDARA